MGAGLALACATPAEPTEPSVRPVDVPARPPVMDAVPAGRPLADRLDEIRRRVEGALEYPSLARHRGVEGEAIVGFALDGRRHARDVRIERSSGSPALDRAALRAVSRAGPFPAVYGRIEVPIRFEIDAPR